MAKKAINELVIMKFGGTSVQDSNSIKNVLRIVKNEKRNKIVVVSAIAKATNSLEEIAHLSAKGKSKQAFNILNALIQRHYKIIEELVLPGKLLAEAIKKIEKYISEIRKLINGLSIIRELSLRTLDAFRIYGELLSSTVIYYAMLSEKTGVELVSSLKIIKTDNEFSRAYPLFDLTQKNVNNIVLPLLRKGKIILTQGFIASTIDGIPTTMGRESSDFSAAIYGSLCNASGIQIWTDVDGILTADPDIIKNPFKLSQISYKEMEELSNFGAKVLHKNSVKPARAKNIPIKILNSKNLSSSGTVVDLSLKYHELVKSITYNRNVMVLRLKPKESLSLYVFWDMMLNILNKHKPQIDLLISSNNAIIIVIAENNYTKIHYDELLYEFEEISEHELIKNKVLITLVGSDLNCIKGLERRIFSAVQQVKPESIAFGYNQHSFSILLDGKYLEISLKNLHRTFFEHNKKSDLFQKIKS
jgi:aspartate kinase